MTSFEVFKYFAGIVLTVGLPVGILFRYLFKNK